MKNSQKGFVLPLLLVIIAVLLVGGGAYVYTQQKPASEPAVVDQNTQPKQSTTLSTNTDNGVDPVQASDSISNVRVISPNGTEIFKFGETHMIVWEAPRNIVEKATALYVSVENDDDKSSYSPKIGRLPVTTTRIDWQIQASRSYGPMLPAFDNLNEGQYRVRVRYEYDYCSIVGNIPGCGNQYATLGEDTSDSYFTIGNQATPVSEQVKCIFNGTVLEQKCYGDIVSPTVGPPVNFSCTGVGSCVVKIKGFRGAQMTLYSGCSGSAGSAAITIDGNNENVSFNCGINKAPTISSLSGPITLERGQLGRWTVQVNDPENDSMRYLVVWGDEPLPPRDVTYPFNWAPGSATVYSVTTFTHAYQQAGTYNISVYAVDADVNHIVNKMVQVKVILELLY